MADYKRLFLGLVVLFLVTKVFAQPATDPVISIALKAAGLQYDQVRFKVKPGADVRVVLTNDDDMVHNLVFTLPGTRVEVVQEALLMGESGLKADYVPKSAYVLAFVPVISPGQSASVSFRAPTAPGVYPYVCTFPGHGFVMYGAMYVTEEEMPELKDDPHVPPSRRAEAAAGGDRTAHPNHSPPVLKPEHPYPLVPPYLFRTFLPDTGPDAIAVNLPHQVSYCWDAGTCRLRYAWQGDFLDFSEFRKSYKKFDVKIAGPVFYRDKTDFPLRIADQTQLPAVKFRGYRLINRYPEFHYTINGMEVFELIHPAPGGRGLIRTFRIPKVKKPIWFTHSLEDGVAYACSKGKWVNGNLLLTPEEAQEFTIVMTKKEGVRL